MFKRCKTTAHLVFLLGHFLLGVRIPNVLSSFYQYQHERGRTCDCIFKPLKVVTSEKIGGSGVTSTLGTWYGGVVMGAQKNSRRYKKFANTILFCFTNGKINNYSYKMAAQ
jgi:hypothetical protein